MFSYPVCICLNVICNNRLYITCNKYVSIDQKMLICCNILFVKQPQTQTKMQPCSWTGAAWATACDVSRHWKHIGDRQRLALVTGRRLPAQGARKEPHETRSHATLVDNLMVTWEIQQQVSPLPGQLAARHTTEETGHVQTRRRFFRTTPI